MDLQYTEYQQIHAPKRKRSTTRVETLPGKPAQMTEESTKNAAKIAFGISISLIMFGIPLVIIGSRTTGEDYLAMLIPGAIFMGIGAFTFIVSVIVRINSGSDQNLIPPPRLEII